MAKADKDAEREDFIGEGHKAWRFLNILHRSIARKIEDEEGMSPAELADVYTVLTFVRAMFDQAFIRIRRYRKGRSDEIRSWDELDDEEQERRGW